MVLFGVLHVSPFWVDKASGSYQRGYEFAGPTGLGSLRQYRQTPRHLWDELAESQFDRCTKVYGGPWMDWDPPRSPRPWDIGDFCAGIDAGNRDIVLGRYNR